MCVCVCVFVCETMSISCGGSSFDNISVSHVTSFGPKVPVLKVRSQACGLRADVVIFYNVYARV